MRCVQQQWSNMVQVGPLGHLWLSTDRGSDYVALHRLTRPPNETGRARRAYRQEAV